MALSRLELRHTDIAEQLKHANNALVEAQVALRSDTTAIRERELREKLADLTSQRDHLQQRATAVTDTLDREVAAAKSLLQFLRDDDLDVPARLAAFAAAEVSTLTSQPNDLPPLQAELQALGNHYTSQDALLTQQSQALRQEAEQLHREINQLRTGDRAASYEAEAPQSSRLRWLLRAELGLTAEQVIPLYEVLRVPDETWQDAVEGILGRTRFDLLVPPEHYDAAMRLYRQRRLEDKLHGVGLPDSARILENSRTPGQNSLAAEVACDHSAGRAFVDLLLGGHEKCDTLEALRDHRTAVTRDCFVRRNFTSSHLNPRFYRRWFIGDRAIPRQIEQREERLAAIAEEMTDLQARAEALKQRLALTRDKIPVFIQRQNEVPLLARLPDLEQQVTALQHELAALDTQSIEALKAEVEQRQAEATRVQQENDRINEQVGSLKAQLEILAEQTIPSLEAQAAEAVQMAQKFLAEEAAEEMLADVQTEYERRRQRQPVETIQENAATQEQRYQSGEIKQRDKLREAKHEYSLKYEFGYDDDEDAGRYLGERTRYIESELPQYEERIAEQRALAEQELVENFIHRLFEQIQDARQQLNYLNTTLAGLRFGGERFEFITQPEPSLREVYQMIMDTHNLLGQSLFESDFRQQHQKGWDILFERLIAPSDEEFSPQLRELQDYRNYLQYDIRIHHADGDRSLLSKISTKKSGGETTTPFYVAMAASFAQAYRINQPRPADTIRLAMFDEAFGKMDTARTASALKFMVDNQLQVLLATPPDKAAGLLPHVDSVRTVVRQNNHAHVIEIDKVQMMKELEGEMVDP